MIRTMIPFHKSTSYVASSILLILALLLMSTGCEEDDLPIPDEQDEVITDDSDTSDGGNNTGDDTYVLLDQFPALPVTPYNYANVTLPPYFNAPPINGQDNTPGNNQVTNAGATLGRVLFYDKHLSANNTVACASCHKQSEGFSDNAVFSTGFEGGLTGRNSMGLANAMYYTNGHFFWDERAASLEAQVLMPIQDGTEMGMNLTDLVNKLSEVEYYEDLFTDVYGDPIITANRISLALSQFVRSMISYRTDFDAGLQSIGNNQNFQNIDFPNFSASENLGKELFFSNRTNCSTCHGTTNFVAPGPRNNGLDLIYADNGIGDVSGDNRDNGRFKVNSLKNVEMTAPYMHDGRFNTLAQVVEHYNSGVQAHPNLSPQLNTGGGPGNPPGGPIQPRRLNLTQAEKTALVDFLGTLTDDAMMNDVKFSDPF